MYAASESKFLPMIPDICPPRLYPTMWNVAGVAPVEEVSQLRNLATLSPEGKLLLFKKLDGIYATFASKN